jgi:hypothetical protein
LLHWKDAPICSPHGSGGIRRPKWTDSILRLAWSINSTLTHLSNSLDVRAIAAVAMIGPILLIIAASKLPEGPETGKFIVCGHGVVLAVVATGLALRAAYALGFGNALKIAGAAPNVSLTA